jgi:hypothetical protein
MQQRQLRLGDILDDYCPRERRLTNHVIVAMIADDVKQTRCTTCDADHEYKHARIPRQRRKGDTPVIAVPVAIAPKKVVHDMPVPAPAPDVTSEDQIRAALGLSDAQDAAPLEDAPEGMEPDEREGPIEEGIVHRKLIRAQLPRHEGQPPATRPGPDFTIRQPATGRPGRFRPRPQQGGMAFQGNRTGAFSGNGNVSGNGNPRGGGGGPRHHGGPPRPGGRHQQPQGQQGRKRSK